MKKILLGLALFVAVAYLPTSSSAQGYKWGSWSADPCFAGLQFRARYDDYNESAKKHKWFIQYKNNYTRDIAFSYNVGGSREDILKDIRAKQGMFRTRIKPGQVDSDGMWVFTNSQSQIFETVGHVRLLGSDEVDYKGPFMTCDSGGNRGQIDTICRNEPTPYFGCQNRPSPPPAAMTFPTKPGRNGTGGKTEASSAPPASPADCLELYKYFSKYSKADDPLAVKQSIDAANAFKARCKLTPEQQTYLDDSITSVRGRSDQLQRTTIISTDGSGKDFFNNADAVKKNDLTGLKQKIANNLRQNIRPWEYKNRVSDYIRVPDKLNADFDDYKNTSIGAKDVNIGTDRSDEITISWLSYYTSKYDKWTAGNSGSTSRIAMTITFQGGISELTFNANNRGMEVGGDGVKSVEDTTELYRGRTTSRSDTSNSTYRLPYGLDSGGNFVATSALSELNALIKQLNEALSGKEVNLVEDSAEADNSARVKPTPVEEYQKKVVAEAKAKGIKIEPDSTNQTPKPRPVLTPRQRAAQNAEATKALAELIQKDAVETAVEREKEARLGPIREIRKQIIENLRMNLKGTRECLAPRYGPCDKQFETIVDLSTDDELVIHLKPRDGSKAMEFRGRFDGLSPFCNGNSTTSSLWLTGIIPFKNVTIYPAGAPNEGVFSDKDLAFDYGTGNIFAMLKQCREISDLVKRLK